MKDSKRYFAEVAGEWDDIRAGFFTEAMRDAAIMKADLPPLAVAADVGTGTGFVIEGLAPHTVQVVGFDESPEMLSVAGRNLAHYTHVDLRLAEGLSLPADRDYFDAVFANMYLHHVPRPAEAIREMCRIIKPGGKLVITDLDSHSQVWMQEAMADQWLGFDRAQVADWFAGAGLQQVDIDCAEGTCDCTAPGGNAITLSIFVAIGQKPA